MKILQICHRVPYPAIDGGNIAMMNMALALSDAENEVHVFALNTKKHYVNPDTIPDDLKKQLNIQSIDIDTTIRVHEVILNLFSNESYNISRFYDKRIESELERLFRSHHFDIVQLETLFTTPYISCIRKNSTAKIVLRAHNVEHIIWERLAEKETNIFRKKYLEFLASRLRKYEIETLNRIDALIPITTVDESVFKGLHFNKPMITVPVSIELKEYNFNPHGKTEMCLFHLGSMDWMPNIEAVEWFLENCWPSIHSSLPTLNLYLAGRSLPLEISEGGYPNVICEGRIENAQSYMLEKQIMIVPLHSGSGMRVKIVQGMALGKTIISTTIGAEGIPITPEENILIADTPGDFIAAVQRCVANPQWCKEIGLKGRKFAEDHYSNAAVGRQLGIFYRALLKHNLQ